MISTSDHSAPSADRRYECLENQAVTPRITPNAPGVLDFCSGLGGLSLAARNLGLHVVAGVDVSSSALKTFAKNFPAALALAGSVRSKTILDQCVTLTEQFRAASQPVLVLSGPPCQGFSAAGSRDPADRRNKVLVAVARAIALLQPGQELIQGVMRRFAESASV